MTCTFTTKYDFSEIDLYEVEAKVDCPQDLNNFNDINKAITKKHLPVVLPFKEDFDNFDEFCENWTVLDRGPSNIYRWYYDYWNEDTNLEAGCVQITCPPENELNPGETYRPQDNYLITDAIAFSEAGLYNISFWIRGHGLENVKILYGTSSNPDNMKVLEDFSIPNTEVWWFVYAWYIPYWDIYHKNFEIESPGNYYFAFCYNSFKLRGGEGIYLDNIRITEGEFAGVPLNLTNIAVSSCDMQENGKIGALMYNIGIEPITEYTLSYQVNDGPLVTQTFTQPIGVREFVEVYFDQKYDFSAIGNYNIKIITSTPIEENPFNYEKELIVTHYTPITNLPFESNFLFSDDRKNWTSPVLGAWWDVYWHQGYKASVMDHFVAPLLSRCITLQPDIYRFKFEYRAGEGEDWTEDFYVTFGKSGTDPFQWKPVKEFMNSNTYKDGQSLIEEELCMIEITEPGEYEIAIFSLNTKGILEIFSATLENAPEHDFSIKKVDFYETARITPAYQFEGEIPLNVTIENSGKTANESGSLKLLHNDNEILSQDFTFTEIGQTKDFEIVPIFGLLPTGDMNLKLNASLSSGINKYWEQLTFVSDSTFAWDSIDDFTGNVGVGFDEPAGMGLVYELRKPDILTSIDVGFVYNEELANRNFILAVYEFDDFGDLLIGNMIMEAKFKRTAGGNTSTTFDVPDTELQPGKKYFFEVRQLDYVNIEIAFDGSNGNVYIHWHWPDFYWLQANPMFGYIHIRPNFGNYGVGMEELRVENGELRVYPNPATSELRVENGELRIEKINIYNAVGQVVMEVSDVNATSYRLNVERLNSGLYFISVQTKSGIVNSKFVKK